MNPPETPAPPSNIRRRNSMSSIPSKLRLPDRPLHGSLLNSAASPSFELISLKSPSSFTTYTSIKDLLPSTSAAAINSPTAGSAANSGYEISIRNRLVKQAAWAYLQPMSSSPDSSSPQLFRRIMLKFYSGHNSICHCFHFIAHIISGLSRAIGRILRSVCLRISR